jgi:hypothetical protein
MKPKTKNKILKTLTATSVVLFILAGCCLDSESTIPIIVLGVSAAYLFLFALANGE